MNRKLIRSRVGHSCLATLALAVFSTGCGAGGTASFNAGAAEKAAAEKGLKPGGPASKEIPKVIKRGRQSTQTGGTPLPSP